MKIFNSYSVYNDYSSKRDYKNPSFGGVFKNYLDAAANYVPKKLPLNKKIDLSSLKNFKGTEPRFNEQDRNILG